eukprot:CAMPEP_0172673650 /NCGR_PEP_ID=MMETSP1074-20121228/12271_1 /TAXON_ID=2916 /ORGANISM="Ceratium fusus, Strain PA161109" /LENGTH=163 /DNA_ID=CAMNT_0013490973 /DNA_START=318 /DNA_END=809 /DNA_ORIENTATION=-
MRQAQKKGELRVTSSEEKTKRQFPSNSGDLAGADVGLPASTASSSSSARRRVSSVSRWPRSVAAARRSSASNGTSPVPGGSRSSACSGPTCAGTLQDRATALPLCLRCASSLPQAAATPKTINLCPATDFLGKGGTARAGTLALERKWLVWQAPASARLGTKE